jgi:hypothetical protein
MPTRIYQIDVRRGRQDEFERHDTGTATIYIHDTEGLYDPTNLSSPYLGQLDSAPVAIAIRNPVTDTWHPLFRGVVDEYGYNLPGSQVKEDVQINCVDALDHLANVEMAPADPPIFGHPWLYDDEQGSIIYEETNPGFGVQQRIETALGDANWPSSLMSIFTGNVTMQRSRYAPGESILTVCQDAADAEWPGIGQLFVDRYGFVCFHGRFARFDPDTVSATATHWDFHRWSAGDGLAIQADPTLAQIRPPFTFGRSRKMIRNAALCYPMDIKQQDIAGQVSLDTASIAQHGLHSWSSTDLLVETPYTSGNTTANEETRDYANYITANYADPQTRLSQVTFKSLRPTDHRAAATWALICQIDISDVITITTTHPGGGGFDNTYYVEGLSYTLTPLEKNLDLGYPAVTLTVDLSPATYWDANPF